MQDFRRLLVWLCLEHCAEDARGVRFKLRSLAISTGTCELYFSGFVLHMPSGLETWVPVAREHQDLFLGDRVFRSFRNLVLSGSSLIVSSLLRCLLSVCGFCSHRHWCVEICMGRCSIGVPVHVMHAICVKGCMFGCEVVSS